MHLMVAWDVGGGGEVPGDVNAGVKDALGGYSWVRPMRGVMIVRIDQLGDRDEIQENLEELAGELDAEGINLRFIVSPAMARGQRYDGFLQERTWPQVNARSG